MSATSTTFASDPAPVQIAARRGRPAILTDYILDEWERFDGPRGGIDFDVFARRVGMTVTGWHRMFYRAASTNDPRAVRVARPPRRTDYSRGTLLNQWVQLGGPDGRISMGVFAERFNMTYDGWRSMLRRARRVGDARAVRPHEVR